MRFWRSGSAGLVRFREEGKERKGKERKGKGRKDSSFSEEKEAKRLF
jgi:hypothetical protein